MQSAVLDMLAIAYAGPHAAKRMAQDSGTSHCTTEKWWQRLTTPRADVMWRMARHNEALRAEMLRVLQGSAYAGLVLDVAGIPAAESGGTAASESRSGAAAIAGSAGCAPAATDAARVAWDGVERRRALA